MLTFIVSGGLWRNSLIMLDKETGSTWSHVTGEGLIGEFEGKRLSSLPAVQTTWSNWISRHPNSKVLKKEEEVRSSSYEEYFQDPDRMGIFRAEWLRTRLPGKKLIYGTTLGPHALAVSNDKLNPGDYLETLMGEKNVVVLRASDGGVRAFLAVIGTQALTFRRVSTERQYVDRETGSIWELDQGLCLDGELRGERLRELPVTAAFWFAWSVFYPNTKVVD